MVQFSRWKVLLTLGICLVGFLIALPNVLPPEVRKLMGQAVILPTQAMNLGLDLRGGSYLLLEVKEGPVFIERLKGKIGVIRAGLRDAQIQYQTLSVSGDTLTVTIPNPEQRAQAKEIISKSAGTISNIMTGTGESELAVTDIDGVFTAKYTDQAIQQIRQQVIDQSIEVVRRRVDGGGVKEASIQRQGSNRILVQVPGLDDPKQLLDLLGKTAKMTFHLVDDSVTAEDIQAGRIPPGTKLLYERARVPGEQRQPVVVQEQVILSGDSLQRATGGFDQQTSQPIVSFVFDMQGARRFGQVTTDNIGRRFAVVLDDEVITAPVIRSAIIGGQGQIEGGFTTKTANDLAVMLNAGALPAAITVEEQRVVSAELGEDSVRYGQYASIAGALIVLLFMYLVYDLFGFFAGVAMIVNAVLMVAVFTIFQITLTLPGVAGFVLSMGMAVDANVLIYERMREEFKNGRGLLGSIDSGFERASATITDANLTQVIAGLIMMEMTTGPVRGFGVSLVLGIITSFFSAIYVTRLLILLWYNTGKRTKLPL
jgi:protein-export membrane protein SecD